MSGSHVGVGLQTDLTVDGRQVRFLNIIDEYTREALATRPFRSCTAEPQQTGSSTLCGQSA